MILKNKLALKSTLLTIMLSLSCIVIAIPPKPAESEYLVTEGGMFLYDEGKIFYAMNFIIKKELPEGYHLKFIFQNTKKKGLDITEARNLKIDGKSILVQSPKFDCIRNNKKYKVVVEIYSDMKMTKKLSKHTQKLEFRVDKIFFESMGIKKC
jgi:hypothetical protein